MAMDMAALAALGMGNDDGGIMDNMDLDVDMEGDGDDDGDDVGTMGAFGASMEDIWAAAEPPSRKRKREMKARGRKKGGGGPPPAIVKKLGEANLLFASGKHREAVSILEGVVRVAPNVADAYQTLGLVYEDMGEVRRAANLFMIAAHLTPNDTDLWKRVAVLSRSMGNVSQALYCLAKVVRRDPADAESRWTQALLLAEVGRFDRAAAVLEPLRETRADDSGFANMLAQMYHKIGRTERAITVLEELLAANPGAVDLTAINILAELYTGEGRLTEALTLVDGARRALVVTGVPPPPHEQYPRLRAKEPEMDVASEDEREWEEEDDEDAEEREKRRKERREKKREEEAEAARRRAVEGSGVVVGGMALLPVDLEVRAGICLLRLGKHTEAEERFATLEPVSTAECADLLELVGDELLAAGLPHKAIPFFRRLVPPLSSSALAVFEGKPGSREEVGAKAEEEHKERGAEEGEDEQNGGVLEADADGKEKGMVVEVPTPSVEVLMPSVEVRAKLAKALEAAGHGEEAAEILQKAVEAERCSIPIRLQLSSLLCKLGRGSDAEKVLLQQQPAGTSAEQGEQQKQAASAADEEVELLLARASLKLQQSGMSISGAASGNTPAPTTGGGSSNSSCAAAAGMGNNSVAPGGPAVASTVTSATAAITTTRNGCSTGTGPNGSVARDVIGAGSGSSSSGATALGNASALEDFLGFVLPLLRQTLNAEVENAAALAQFRDRHPTWRPWMGRLRRALREEVQQQEEGDAAALGLYRGLRFQLPRGIQFNLLRRRKLAQMAMESASKPLTAEQKQQLQQDKALQQLRRLFREVQPGNDSELSMLAVPQAASSAQQNEGGGVAAAAAIRKSRDAQTIQKELADLQIPDVEEPELLPTPLPRLYSDPRQFTLLLQACVALLRAGRAAEAEQLVGMALDVGRSKGMTKEQRRDLRAVIADEASGVLQFDIAQQLILEQPYGLRGWEIFHRLTLRGIERNDRRAKFLQSMRARYPACVPAMVISGHHHAVAGLLHGAAREYLKAFRLQPNDPLIALCCGVSLLNLAQGSRLRNRSQCVLQAFAFFHHYAELRQQSQEAMYNVARAYHQVGLLHLAVNHYEKVLASPPVVRSTPLPPDLVGDLSAGVTPTTPLSAAAAAAAGEQRGGVPADVERMETGADCAADVGEGGEEATRVGAGAVAEKAVEPSRAEAAEDASLERAQEEVLDRQEAVGGDGGESGVQGYDRGHTLDGTVAQGGTGGIALANDDPRSDGQGMGTSALAAAAAAASAAPVGQLPPLPESFQPLPRLIPIARDLTREAAHNLVLIYRNSGAEQLARQVMHDYLSL